MRRGAALALAMALAACAGPTDAGDPPAGYLPSWRDYSAFAAAWPDLLEPNYLPFMVHREPSRDPRGDLLFFCRWPDAAMPLPVYVTAARVPDSLQDEFAWKDPAGYAEAVRRALATWERELEGHVSFRLVDRERDARLVVRLVARRAPEPEPDLQVLGTAKLADACRVLGQDPDAEVLAVRFAVPELELFLADRFGLLAADQVEWIALHEIGHALGMRGHSPIPADLMYEVARDRVTVHEGLSIEDVNSFVSLYSLPNGTIFGRAPHRRSDVAPEPVAPGAPLLAMAPYVDVRLGFELRPPSGWVRLPTSHGMVVVHGTTWDYAASFQIVVQRYPRIADYIDRYGEHYLRRGRVSPPAPLVVNGRRAVQVEIARYDAPLFEQVTLVEVGDGRLLVVTADAPRALADAYRPWFAAVLGSLEITDLPEEAWPLGRRRSP